MWKITVNYFVNIWFRLKKQFIHFIDNDKNVGLHIYYKNLLFHAFYKNIKQFTQYCVNHNCKIP